MSRDPHCTCCLHLFQHLLVCTVEFFEFESRRRKELVMDERSNHMEKADEVILPGFRFHLTDEELVGFYLNRKIHQKPLSIDLIRQLDIYKYDAWDLPSFDSIREESLTNFLDDVDDQIKLSYLNEPSILRTLKCRLS